jgi:hypothetical protein
MRQGFDRLLRCDPTSDSFSGLTAGTFAVIRQLTRGAFA